MNRKALFAAALAAVAAGGYVGWRLARGQRPGSQAAAVRYTCPMHPQVVKDRPGECPICGMTLVKREASAAESRTAARFCVLHKCGMAHCEMELPHKPGETVSCPVCGTHVVTAPDGKPLFYRHPMRPGVTSPVPMKDEMGMDYLPVYAEGDGGGVPGQASVTLDAERRQLIGLKSETVVERALERVVRASGRVAYDPDLYNAITEYREAVRSRDRLAQSPLPDAREGAEALVKAAALRLRRLGLSEAQIAGAGTEAAPTNLLVGGGGSVWVYAQIYEAEVGLVKPGQEAALTTQAYPGRTFRGVVRSLDPNLDPDTRSLKARIEVPNKDGALKLEMYVDASIGVPLGRRLALPESALIDTGARTLAFVDLGEGRLEPRAVVVGTKAQGYYELKSGVAAGEKVVISANFLVDSESRLKGALR